MGTIVRELWVPREPAEVFPFFADAFNLETITPPWLRFRVLTPAPIEMRRGAVVNYSLRFRGVPVRWQGEIAAWEPPDRFVDEQRRGPYRRWIHEHSFDGIREGTLVCDRVNYEVPGGWLVERAFVARDLDRIFDYRSDVLRRVFEG